MKQRFIWTPELVEMLRREYPHRPSTEIAERLGITKTQVYSKAQHLGLHKTEEFLQSGLAGRFDGTVETGQRFKPGQVSWNKGKHYMPKFTTTEHLFRKGQQARNKLPIGSYRLHVGYLQVKVRDTGYTPNDWDFVHRVVWQQAHGTIPPKHIVRFKRGTHTTDRDKITPDILECITRSELFAENSVAQYGPEIRALIQLRGAITRQIQKRERKTNHE